MPSHRTEAIVLNVIPFQDAHQIATLFTPDLGLCRAIGSYSRSPKNALFGNLTPLNHIEVIFRSMKGDLFKIESASLIHGHQEIRKDYDRLNLACKMTACVAKSQFPHKPSPMLFELLKGYLHLMLQASPITVFTSFQLKTLRHEGLLSVTNACASCGKESKEMSIEGGRTVCASHSENSLFQLTEEETAHFYALALSTSAKFLNELQIPETLAPKIAHLFEASYE